MTQTIREQLQALVDELRLRLLDAELSDRRCVFEIPDLLRLKAILATPEPAVTVRKGWVCKDNSGIWWYSDKPFWDVGCEWWDNNGTMHQLLNGAITDPWPDHPNGGPECVMQVTQ